jgi:hypothetical protein
MEKGEAYLDVTADEVGDEFSVCSRSSSTTPDMIRNVMNLSIHHRRSSATASNGARKSRLRFHLFTVLIRHDRSSCRSGIGTETNTFFFSRLAAPKLYAHDSCSS